MRNTDDDTLVNWNNEPYQYRWYEDGVLYLRRDKLPKRVTKRLDEISAAIWKWLNEKDYPKND